MVGNLRLAAWSAPLLFVAVLFYWPLTNILGLGAQGDWLGALAAPKTIGVIAFTIGQAIISTLLCIVIGIPGAMMLYRRKYLGYKFLRALLTVPFVLPTIVVAISLTGLRSALSEFPILVILIAHVLVNYALTVRTVGGVWATLDNEIDEAAELDGASRLQVFLQITLPLLRPAIISAAALTFLFCVSSFAIILVLGGGQIQSIETLIYSAANQFLDLKTASALAIVQTLITVIAFAISKRFGSATSGLDQVEENSSLKRLNRRDAAPLVITFLVILFLIVLPLGSMLIRALFFEGGFSLQNFANLAGQGSRDLLNISVWQAAGNSLRNAAIATGISVTLGVLIAWLLSRTKPALLELLFLLPLGVSSVVLGFGYLITFGGQPLPLRSSWLVMPLVQALIATPIVIRLVHPALLSIGLEPRDSAANAGANAWQTWWLVEAGMIRGVLKTALGFAAIVSIGEFGAASLLTFGDQATLPVVLYQLISRPGEQNYGMAMAASALLIVLSLLILLATSSNGLRIRNRLQHLSNA